jgi:hypothetical protein
MPPGAAALGGMLLAASSIEPRWRPVTKIAPSEMPVSHAREDRCVRAFVSSFVALLISAPAYCASPSAQEADVYAGLLHWAVELSGYEQPTTLPRVEFVSQAFFNEHACGGRPCRVWGWYPNTGKDVVYVHESARELIKDGSDPRSLLAASIVVHEFTHYLQAVDRGSAPYACSEAIELEHEAYTVQNAYLVAYGRYLHVGLSMHTAGCTEKAPRQIVVSASRERRSR